MEFHLPALARRKYIMHSDVAGCEKTVAMVRICDNVLGTKEHGRNRSG